MWEIQGINLHTKLNIYKPVILNTQLYGCESWTTYRGHKRKVNHFHLEFLRHLLFTDDILATLHELPLAECPMKYTVTDCLDCYRTSEVETFEVSIESFPSNLFLLGHMPLEEPMLTQEETEVSVLMPPLNKLASKFEIMAVQDPLKKKDETLWTEKDFFQPVYTQEPSDPHDVPLLTCILDEDEFPKVTFNRMAESFVSPLVAKHIPETLKAKMCEPDMDEKLMLAPDDLEQVLNLEQEQQPFKCFVGPDNAVDCVEKLGSSDNLAEEKDQPSFFIKMNQSDLTPENAGNYKVKRTPFLELRDTDISDYVESTLQQSVIPDAFDKLDLRKEEVTSAVYVTSTFLRAKELKKIELNLWVKEKNNDEMQIPEPSMSPSEKPPNSIKQATELISLTPVTLESKVAHVLTDPELSHVTVPLLNIDILEADMEESNTKPIEEVHKDDAFELVKQPAKSEVQSCAKEQIDVHVSKKPDQSLQQGFEIRIQPVPFKGPMEDILLCLVESAAPYLEYMKRAQRISGSETLMSISVDSARFLFKEIEKQFLEQEDIGY
ncbi:hypothetical protein ElyMa_001923000 [Elysia marginata]|uniref:Uncharacterized protein n=1 Tax=Elysia marginata TaxID=1093978 RepID=A0AAV4EVT6_9GAST|nr:hypothetical protein ElyMa_001923000 [Elysia marginata]